MGGYIEKQVAYLSGKFFFMIQLPVPHIVCVIKRDAHAFVFLQEGAGKTQASSSPSQNAQRSVTFERKL